MSATHAQSAVATVSGLRGKLRRRSVLVSLGLLALAFVVFSIAMVLGDYPVTAPELVTSIFSPFTGIKTQGVDFIVLGVRLPRALMALLSGAAFGLSGVIFQTLLRNPLASPDIVGITQGASAAAVICIIGFGWSGFAVALGAFGGALATAMAIYLLAHHRGLSAYRMVLIGIGMAAILSAVISYVFTRARIEDAQKAMAWLVGSLNGSTFEQMVPLAIALLVLVPAAMLLARPLGVMQLGDDTAIALGTPVERARTALMVIAVALSAFATAAVGPLAFVAFVSGPIARRLLGPAGFGFIAAALTGAVVTLGSDIIAQHFIRSSQLPAGVVTGGFGALFLIYLLVVSNRSGRGG